MGEEDKGVVKLSISFVSLPFGEAIDDQCREGVRVM